MSVGRRKEMKYIFGRVSFRSRRSRWRIPPHQWSLWRFESCPCTLPLWRPWTSWQNGKEVFFCALCLCNTRPQYVLVPPSLLFFANCPLFVLVCRFNISPLSVNISTTEFSLLDSLPKVNPHNSPGEVILYVMAAKWLYQFFKCRYIFLPLPIHSILPLFLFCRQARARRTWLEKVSCVCCYSPGRPERSL